MIASPGGFQESSPSLKKGANFGKKDEIDDMWHDRIFSNSKTSKSSNPRKVVFSFLLVYTVDYTISSFVWQKSGPFTQLTSNSGMPRVGNVMVWSPVMQEKVGDGQICASWRKSQWLEVRVCLQPTVRVTFLIYLGQDFKRSLCLKKKHVQHRSSLHCFLKIDVFCCMELISFLNHVLIYPVWCKLALVRQHAVLQWRKKPLI